MGSSRRRALLLLLAVLLASSLCAGSAAPLAAQRTRRKDPLDGLRPYAGGWNISDRHYIAVSAS
uniref:Uncharacterized protein n=1 Tax=Aegilops tauschii subsp. strangulata TaxID=200361 RepID=A0A452XCA2_AEGTS